MNSIKRMETEQSRQARQAGRNFWLMVVVAAASVGGLILGPANYLGW